MYLNVLYYICVKNIYISVCVYHVCVSIQLGKLHCGGQKYETMTYDDVVGRKHSSLLLAPLLVTLPLTAWRAQAFGR